MLDIVIPVRGQLEYFRKTIDSVIKNTFIDFRIFIVNDQSEDKELLEYLKFLENFRTYVTVINSGYRRYWSGCCNIGAANGDGEHICFLHSDTYVKPHWALYLINTFKITFGCSAMGPRTSWSNTKQTIIEYEESRESLSRDEIEKISAKGKPVSSNVDSFCFLTSRENWNKVGSFNEEIWKGLYAELDWQLKAVDHELYPYIARSVYVHHYGKKSYEKDLNDYNKTMSLNLSNIVSSYSDEVVKKIIK